MTDLVTAFSNRLLKLEAEKKELDTQKSMLDDALANEPTVVSAKEALEDARRIYKMEREAILNEPENRSLVERIKDVRAEIKDLTALLTGDMLGIFKEHGKLQVEGVNGKLYDLSFNGKAKETDQPSMFEEGAIE